jgi:competence protein ComEA
MRTRPDHREAVARRLELLRAELDPDGMPSPDEDPWWETAPVLELVPPVTADAGAPPVPVPGRHAARRRRSPLAWLGDRTGDAVPEELRGRVGVGPWHLTVLALLVAAALAVTVWWVVRSDPAVPPVPSGAAAPLVTVSASASGDASGAATGAAAASMVTVDVVGKVRHPSVVDLPAGSRVLDAIKAAGGSRPGVDLSGLNRARLVVDGEQIVVGAPAATAVAPGAPAPSAGTATGAPVALVNLNTATVEELDTLPEVGPVTAQAILDYRTEHGGFASVEELLDIEGIGEKTLAKIAPHVTV